MWDDPIQYPDYQIVMNSREFLSKLRSLKPQHLGVDLITDYRGQPAWLMWWKTKGSDGYIRLETLPLPHGGRARAMQLALAQLRDEAREQRRLLARRLWWRRRTITFRYIDSGNWDLHEYERRQVKRNVREFLKAQIAFQELRERCKGVGVVVTPTALGPKRRSTARRRNREAPASWS